MFAWVGFQSYSGYVINSAPDGWTLLGSQTGDYDKYYLYSKVAGAGEPGDYTWGADGAGKFAITISTYRDGFDTADPIDVVSNTVYRTNNTTVRAASMAVSAADSPLVFFGANYTTGTATFTKPSVPTNDWVEDYDGGVDTSDFWREICSMVWAGSGATGNMDATSTASLSTKHAFAVALNPPAGGPAGVKTICDLAIASVKTINDLAIASVKTINDSAA